MRAVCPSTFGYNTTADADSWNSKRRSSLEECTVPSYRPRHLRCFRPDRCVHVMVPHLAALHSLPQTMGAAAHHPCTVHGPHLRDCFLPLLLLLPAFDLPRGLEGLLRGFCNSKFLCAVVPLHRAGFTQSERLLPWLETQGLGLAPELAQKMLWRRSWLMEDTKEWIDLVQREPCYMRRTEHPDELT